MGPLTPGFAFRTLAVDGHARSAVLTTPHGEVETPTFMPVGTQGSVKGLSPDEVAATGARIVLGNTYHLWLRPGPELIDSLGGLHAFTRWPHAMLTDSGGFQAFSLAQQGPRTSVGPAAAGAKISEEGVVFRSHLDGSRRAMTPEESMRVQGLIGADISMQLDECPPLGEEKVRDRAAIERAVARTTRWAHRCLAVWRGEHRPRGHALFGIVQGGTFVDLRARHAEELAAIDDGFDGLALGGFSVGEPIEMMYEALSQVAWRLDAERPRYLMGVGTPLDLLEGIEHGVDMFDCVLPTRNARNGQALTRSGKVNIKQARFRDDKRPLDERCGCPCCVGGYSRAYLRHLFIAGEMLVLRLLSIHNLWTFGALMAGARAAIREGRYLAYKRAWIDGWNAGLD
ncbi:MAG: tRNA guanosine(34) transglycosylase Tgt [Deltaproteobacteria bacterium]|nr:tRNA guanosine(34) transglycosylase Tgt [Deltaproteobacteria bacterium]